MDFANKAFYLVAYTAGSWQLEIIEYHDGIGITPFHSVDLDVPVRLSTTDDIVRVQNFADAMRSGRNWLATQGLRSLRWIIDDDYLDQESAQLLVYRVEVESF